MKIIDLLNKIANDEEVPEKIGYAGQYWIYRYPNDYEGLGYGGCLLNNVCLNNLNDEIIILEEPKGIPEKLDVDKEEKGKFIIWSTEFEQCTTLEMKIIKRQDYVIKKINEIIDYLESKGEYNE